MSSSHEISQSELVELGEGCHRGQIIGCPRCGSRLRPETCPYVPKRSVDIYFYCERCGACGRYEPKDIRDDWSDAQWQKICDEYYREGEARCPFDGAIVWGGKDQTLGSHAAHLRCPICGAARYDDARGNAKMSE